MKRLFRKHKLKQNRYKIELIQRDEGAAGGGLR